MSKTKALNDCIDYYRYEWLSIKDQEHHEEVADLASSELDALEKDLFGYKTLIEHHRKHHEDDDATITQLRTDLAEATNLLDDIYNFGATDVEITHHISVLLERMKKGETK